MAPASLCVTVCCNMPPKAAKTTINFCQRNRREYPKATYFHWRKLLVLFEPNYDVFYPQTKTLAHSTKISVLHNLKDRHRKTFSHIPYTLQTQTPTH